ncbi:hypothetical protein ZOSMA_109G00040 [Zostera marina]|uniref:Dymeclin n=1 Tax=Zostera marina TaxID=29655 RepID=A0A0K9Q407_ZOSMR|nr:hypothetical protein ZOSMA_109G00040 [Zostera marina]
MGAAPSTPGRPINAAEYLISTFVGDQSYPVKSDFWQKLLEFPLFTLHWSQNKVTKACEVFAQNNIRTGHMAKILIHLVWSLEAISKNGSSSSIESLYTKSFNATHMSSIFLKYLIENTKTNRFEELCLSLHDNEMTNFLPKVGNFGSFIMHGILSFICSTEVSPHSCLLHHELLNFIIVAMSTQLRLGPIPELNDMHPFIDAVMDQDDDLVCSVVRRLLLNYITRPHVPINGSSYLLLSDNKQPGVLQRVGTAAASLVLFPYYTFNYLVSSSGENLRSPLVDKSLLILLILVHYRKCVSTYPLENNIIENGDSDLYLKDNLQFFNNPYRKAFENARDVEFDRLDVERNGHSGSLVNIVRLPYASLFDNLGLSLGDETSILLLYSLVHGNSDFLEYVLVRTDIDTLLMPILETLYNASKRKPNQIYMLLIILLILSQDSSFNASIHNLVVPSIPWYQERLLTNTSLGSLMVIILIRTVKYNLSKLRDVYLHTNCLATLANMAPHVHRLSAYASQRLISLFDMISRKYTKLAERLNDKVENCKNDQAEYDKMVEDTSTELHLYTDFLRIVLETINLILTYALPRNPEVVYAIMHRQEVFQPFKNHPRFNELLENIYTVLDFFNTRMDTQQIDGGWSVDKVLEVIIINCRSWHGEGMKMFTQLRFTYEEENHSEEFFIPYIWQLVMSHSGFTFDAGAIDLFAVETHVDDSASFSDDAIV